MNSPSFLVENTNERNKTLMNEIQSKNNENQMKIIKEKEKKN